MQALEEQRRRDPVKRAVLVGICLVAVILVWITSLMVEKFSANAEITGLEQKIQSGSKQYKEVLDNQQNLVAGRQKLTSLHQLSTNRFLLGNLLEAMQKSSVDNVQLTRLKIDQAYIVFEGTKPTTNETGAVTQSKPATTTEKISITINAKDAGPVPGDAISRYQSALSHNPIMRSLSPNRTNDFRLTTSLTPQSDPDGRTFVTFTLEARLPDKIR